MLGCCDDFLASCLYMGAFYMKHVSEKHYLIVTKKQLDRCLSRANGPQLFFLNERSCHIDLQLNNFMAK